VHEVVGLLRLVHVKGYRILSREPLRHFLPGIDLVGSHMGCAPLLLDLIHLWAVIKSVERDATINRFRQVCKNRAR
jgi:hypothetical protein